MKCTFVLFSLFGLSACKPDDNIRWGPTYSYDAILTVPGAGIEEPYKVWVDGKTGNTRVDYYNGLVKQYKRKLYGIKNNFQYFKVHPQVKDMYSNEEVCHILPVNGLLDVFSLNTYLPMGDFVYQDPDELDGTKCERWQSSNYVDMYGYKVLYSHTVWVNRMGNVDIPLRYDFKFTADGVVLDEYHHKYWNFRYTDIDNIVFEIPDGLSCNNYTTTAHESIDSLIEYLDPEYGYSKLYKSFESFKNEHNKVYRNDTEQFLRMLIFKDNLRYINSENRKHKTYTLAVNHFADLNDEEFSALMRTTLDPEDVEDNNDNNDELHNLYEEEKNYTSDKLNVAFDWTDFGAVTLVKEQTEMCGSCYAFATAAAVESALYVQRGFRLLVEISEQAIIDCSWSGNGQGNFGCEGGTLKASLDWVIKQGVPLKLDYGPYLAMEGFCHHSSVPRLALIHGYTKLNGNIDKIKFTLRKRGPLLLGINTSPKTFRFYSGGIYTDKKCSSNPLHQNHAIVMTGYGIEHGLPYWTLKNSFGAAWGEYGFIRIAIPSNVCGVANTVYSVDAGADLNDFNNDS